MFDELTTVQNNRLWNRLHRAQLDCLDASEELMGEAAPHRAYMDIVNELGEINRELSAIRFNRIFPV